MALEIQVSLTCGGITDIGSVLLMEETGVPGENHRHATATVREIINIKISI